MPDIINLLPDAVANQIAAGEVIQRPSSAIKELLENAVDAGASEISVYIKDAGKSLIRVIDNGCGMSETDARMCFERHATSKINKADDLFSIKTLGFRGEALASIAAIAQVELKTKKTENEWGTILRIDASNFISQKPCPCENGTALSIKNLFFNVPARRKFLKSNTAEMRHIMEEFHRVALVKNNIAFKLFNNDKLLEELPSGRRKQRIINIFGSAYSQRLVSINQDTESISIEGFILKPEFSKKTRGEQYFFVNGRFIKHSYLNHAVSRAFDELIPSDAFPSYFIYLEVNPQEVDVNIHPTKTEVNFSNQQYIYAILNAAVKESLGKFNIIPSIDFSINQDFTIPHPSQEPKNITAPEIKIDPTYNPFETNSGRSGQKQSFSTGNTTSDQSKFTRETKPSEGPFFGLYDNQLPFTEENNINVFQLNNTYLVSSIKSGLIIIDQHRAHARILFEEYLEKDMLIEKKGQQQMFPITFHLNPQDADIMAEIGKNLSSFGFEIEPFGKNTFLINAYPPEIPSDEVKNLLEDFIEQFKNRSEDLTTNFRSIFARSLALRKAIPYGKKLKNPEMNNLIDRLFGCQVPGVSPDGTTVYRILTLEEFHQFFNKPKQKR